MLQKYINGWLPTNGHKSTGKHETQQLCPCCNDEIETNSHFIQCPADRDTWQKAIDTITKCKEDLPQYPLYQLLRSALSKQTQATSQPDEPPDDTPIMLYPLYNEQQRIGWHHIITGHWTNLWVASYDQLTKTTTGEQWARKVLKQLWKNLLQKWKRRCEKEHET
jgi:hypothetical protein